MVKLLSCRVENIMGKKREIAADQHFLLFLHFLFDPLPNDKIFDMTKRTAFADNRLKVARIMIFLFDSAENTENPFPTVFSKAFFSRVAKSWDCVVKS